MVTTSIENSVCFLCGISGKGWTYRKTLPPGFRGAGDIIKFYDCPNCGHYGIDKIVEHNIDASDKQKLSQLAAERHLHHKIGFILSNDDKAIFIDGLPLNKMETLLKDYPQDAIEILDRAFYNCATLLQKPTEVYSISELNTPALQQLPIRFNQLTQTMFIEKNAFSFITMLNQLEYCDYIRIVKNIPDLYCYFLISPKGWQHFRELKKRPAGDSRQAFVAMWFDKNRESFYSAIEKACTDTGYKALRIDNKEHNEKICDQIIAEIRKSRILIADMTGQRGGVYFEAGFALGFGLPVIYVVDQCDKDKLHFDTRQYNHIIYENDEDLYVRLKHRIEATVPVNDN
jgi:nucleoside 2-deoxyribosyltransferase